MVEDLHGDKHGKPRRRRHFEKLVIVCAHVVCAQLMGEIALEGRREQGSRIDHCVVAPGVSAITPYRSYGSSIPLTEYNRHMDHKEGKVYQIALATPQRGCRGWFTTGHGSFANRSREINTGNNTSQPFNLLSSIARTIPTYQESTRVVPFSHGLSTSEVAASSAGHVTGKSKNASQTQTSGSDFRPETSFMFAFSQAAAPLGAFLNIA